MAGRGCSSGHGRGLCLLSLAGLLAALVTDVGLLNQDADCRGPADEGALFAHLVKEADVGLAQAEREGIGQRHGRMRLLRDRRGFAYGCVAADVLELLKRSQGGCHPLRPWRKAGANSQAQLTLGPLSNGLLRKNPKGD